MYTFMRQVNEEWLPLSLLLHPVKSMIGQQVRDVCRIREFLTLAVDVQRGIVVFSLSAESLPVIEAFAWMVTLVAHVPLTEEGSLVSRFLKQLRKIKDLLRLRRGIVNHGMTMRVHPRQQTVRR